jgi:hypothetical protein
MTAWSSQPSLLARDRSIARRTMLGCGVLASVLYVLTDLLGGFLHYPGYSFNSQMVSELMAAGAPSEHFVDPLFMLSGALSLAFAVAIIREAADHRALRIAGFLFLAYAVIGLTGPTLFEMHPRDSGLTGWQDKGHIILTAVIVILMLLTMGFGGAALGGRFRVYSIATIVIVVAFGLLAAPAGMRLAAGKPTPWFGIIERVNIYASMLWFAALAVALLRTRMTHAREDVGFDFAVRPT